MNNNNTYNKIKENISELNKIQDEINLLEWNTDDEFKCANFNSVEEMKEFEEKVLNGEFDFIFSDEDINNIKNTGNIIESYEHTLDNINFYIYTYEDTNNNYTTYMAIKNIDDDNTIDKLYGYKTSIKSESHDYFEKLKNDISNNTLEYILENIVIDIENNIKNLKIKYDKMVNES